MSTSLVFRFAAALAIACVTLASPAQEQGSRWRLRVMDLHHQLKAEGIIRLTNESDTESCIGGEWKRAVVETRTVQDESFFPLAEPQAYEIRGGNITLGRTRMCDGYLFMTGKLDDHNVHGAFYALGLGSNQNLGYFSLAKIP
jgi:hypothetical protein